MRAEVQAPVEYAGDLMGDLNGRHGRISGMETKGNTQIIRALVPMSEMLNYQNDLISMTQGRASYSMEFDHYDFVPGLQAEKVIAAAKAAKAGVEEEENKHSSNRPSSQLQSLLFSRCAKYLLTDTSLRGLISLYGPPGFGAAN